MVRVTLRVALFAVCSIAVAWVAVVRFENSIGIDFFHYWGVKSALAEGTLRGTNPYEDREAYRAVLDDIVARSGDRRLRAASDYRQYLDLTGTPLQYTVFAVLPAGYSHALALYQLIQVLCFTGAVWLVFRARWPRWEWCAVTIAVMAAALDTLGWDIRAGNLDAIQLFAITGLAFLLYKRGSSGGGVRPALFNAGYAAALVALTLFKPNIFLIAAALAVSMWLKERPVAWRTVSAAAVAGAILLVIPCVYFGNWNVWLDWLTFLRAGLSFPSDWGNFSTVVLLMEDLGISITVALSIVISLFTAGALLGIALRPRGVASRLFSDPFRAVALGILVTAAVSPVYWFHYYLFCFFAALYLLLPPRKPWPFSTAALVSIALTANWVGPLIQAAGVPRLQLYAMAAGWLVLVPVLFWDQGSTPPTTTL